MAHIFERVMQGIITFVGGSFGFYNGDVLKLKLDLAELRPTIFASVPRLFNKFADTILENINKLTGIKKDLVEKGLATKLKNLHEHAQYTHSVYDLLVFNKMRAVFGGRVRYMITASAPISEKTLDFLKVAFCCPIFECFGQTEVSGASHLTTAKDGRGGHVGGPMYHTEAKLVDVPEMNYTSKDKDLTGDPLPRGEVWLRSSSMFKGYYKDPEKTAETITKDGWVKTGDIGQVRRDGSFQIIDRKKNIFKLAIGEYIAPEKIENVYGRSRYVAESFVHGDSLQHYLIGFFVPNPEALKELATAVGVQGDMETLCKDKKVQEKFLEEINKKGKEEKLFSFELVKKIRLEPISLATKGLLTPSFKLKRYEAKLYFKDTIDRMYAEGLAERA